MLHKILVTDFDGTLTRTDFYTAALKRLPPEASDFWIEYEQGKITHFEALASTFAMLTVDEAEYSAMLEEMQLEPKLENRLQQLEAAGWRVEIASAGCACYIKRLLDERGIKLKVYANPGEFKPNNGVIMHPPVGESYFSPDIGVDKEGIVRTLLKEGADVAFAGDGRADLAPILLLPENRRFAKGWLAYKLNRMGERFTSFDNWSEVAMALIKVDL